MSKDRSRMSKRMSKNRYLLLKTKQEGSLQIGGYFIDIRQYDEPTNPERERRRRYESKRQYLEAWGINIYGKLKREGK